VSGEAPTTGGAASAPLSKRDRDRQAGKPREREKGKGGLWVFLIAGALPVAGITWFMLQPEEQRRQLTDKIPGGWAGRAMHAGLCFVAMLVLARVALPAFHGATAALRGTGMRMAQRRGWRRALLYPLELLVHLLLILVQVLFFVDALLIVAAGLLLLLLVARIVKPDLLPGILPSLGA
jgi:hypothetical protein